MFRIRRHFTRLFLPLALVGLHLSAVEALAQEARETFAYSPPTVSLTADRSLIEACEGDDALVHLTAQATSPSGNPIRYTWRASTGRIEGEGPAVTWNLRGARPGQHKAYLVINTGSSNDLCEAFVTTVVEVRCVSRAKVVCPSVGIICPEQFAAGRPITFSSNLKGGSGNVPSIYNWTVSTGRIISGQGTNSITVDTTGMEGQALRATLAMAGYEEDCLASCTIQFPPLIAGRKFDAFPKIARNDEKARLDNFTIGLQDDPTSIGYIIIYPGPDDQPGSAKKRATQISDYMVNSRGFDSKRIITLLGSQREKSIVELWIRPQGAPAPSF